MRINKRTIKTFGLCICIICSILFLWGRQTALSHLARQSRGSAARILETYSDSIQSDLNYRLNHARDLALSVAPAYEAAEHFRRTAQPYLADDASFAGLIKGDEFLIALPESEVLYRGQSVHNLPYAFNMTGATGKPVMEGPVDYFNDRNDYFVFTYPIEIGSTYWGQTVVFQDAQRVREELKLQHLSEMGYAYELWQVNIQDGHKNTVAVSQQDFDFSQAERSTFYISSQWTLTIMPVDGWVNSATRVFVNLVTCLLILLILIAARAVTRFVILRYNLKMGQQLDLPSGLPNRSGFEKAVDQWIRGGKEHISILLFDVNGFCRTVLLMDLESQRAYLAGLRDNVKDGVLSPHIFARVGEESFFLAVQDIMTEEELSNLARSLALKMQWKSARKLSKEFFNISYQTIRYPEDGKDAQTLTDKVIRDYYARVDSESPILSLTEKCRQLIRGNQNVVFEEYTNAAETRLSRTINQYRKQVEQLAYQDTVYHIGNRSKYTKDVATMISYAKKRPFTLYCIDIRGFGRYNELFSVKMGDQILNEVSQRLRRLFGDYLYRINGDVFLGIVQEEGDITDTLSRIRTQLGMPMVIDVTKLVLEAHYGICSYPQHGKTAEELLECVQTALHYAKRQGTQMVVYDEALTAVLRREAWVLRSLEEGLEKETLEVWYQPIMELRSGMYRFAEALIRLPDGDGGFLPASEVIDIAEKNRIVGQIGTYALKKVSRLIKSKAKELGLWRIAVNLSVQELMQEDCIENILEIVNGAEISPQRISLEVTETVLIQSFAQIRPMLEKLQQAGFHVVLDDFGVGYSSLNYFSSLPVDVLKIDRSLTCQVSESGKQSALLKAIVEMARINGILVVAEGVETEKEQAAIRELGVDLIQGYFYARPVPQDKLLELLRQNRESAEKQIQKSVFEN